MVARLALGMFEAGFSPMLPLYLCAYFLCALTTVHTVLLRRNLLALFYTREEFGVRTSWWFMFSAVAGAFGGLIAFGVQHIHSATADWRLLFIIEGIPTILLGILSLFILPDRLEETSVLTEREREIAMERMNRGTKADIGRVIQRRKFIQVYSAIPR